MNQHIGAIGDKLSFAATYGGAIALPPHIQWGQRYLYTFIDADTNAFIWVTQTKPKRMGYEPGATVRVSGAVKRHGEFLGVKQTELTRCAVDDGRSYYRLTGGGQL